MTPAELINHNMTNHPPANDSVVEDLNYLRGIAKRWAHTINGTCPASRERSLALTAAEESLMWAIAAIVRSQQPEGTA